MKKGMVWKGILLVIAFVGGLFTVSYMVPSECSEEVLVSNIEMSSEKIPESERLVKIPPKESLKFDEISKVVGPPTVGLVPSKTKQSITNDELRVYLMSQQSRIDDQTKEFDNRQKIIKRLLN
ncbi:MAG: hypothetical protein B7C24_15320 [Bacteroidetes bacterium 4572_77]|nr:MAG: hypothetical protein B7C24_15320 [Bacteroidetes bacterium 4572_77]